MSRQTVNFARFTSLLVALTVLLSVTITGCSSRTNQSDSSGELTSITYRFAQWSDIVAKENATAQQVILTAYNAEGAPLRVQQEAQSISAHKNLTPADVVGALIWEGKAQVASNVKVMVLSYYDATGAAVGEPDVLLNVQLGSENFFNFATDEQTEIEDIDWEPQVNTQTIAVGQVFPLSAYTSDGKSLQVKLLTAASQVSVNDNEVSGVATTAPGKYAEVIAIAMGANGAVVSRKSYSWTVVSASQEVKLTILETNDVHGHLTNYDYALDRADGGGLDKCATIVKKERALDPQLLLVDCGDMSQGNLIDRFHSDPISPVARALNVMDYDIWVLGNHEFNFEFRALQSSIRSFRGDVLAGNIYKKDGTRFANPYVIKNIRGVKVAIIGVDAPHIPAWENDPAHYDHMTFTSPKVEIGKILQELKAEQPDVTIVMAHYGEAGEKGEPGMYEIGKTYSQEVDAFLIGHSHNKLLKYYNGKEWSDTPTQQDETCLMQTGCQAKNVGKLTLTLQRDAQTGSWNIQNRKVELLSCADVESDSDMFEMLQDIFVRSIVLANGTIGKVTRDFIEDPLVFPHMPKAFFEPTPLTDFINTVMMAETGADVAMTPIFREDANCQAGDLRYKDVCQMVPYENTLKAVKITGAQLKAIMEAYTGSFFTTPVAGDVTLSFAPNTRFDDYDVYKGINYVIDVSQPEGNRIKNLVFKGQPLSPNQELVVALNSYRYGQLLHKGLVREENLVYSSDDTSEAPQIREIIAQYIKKHKVIEPTCEQNWRIVGYEFNDPQRDLVYDMITEEKIKIPVSPDGRRINCAAINAIKLRAEGVLPPLKS